MALNLLFLCVCLTSLLHGTDAYSDDWDIFTFAQEWPRAVCENGRHHKCVIPNDVFSWGIHGLWPTKRGTHGPTSCDRQRPFNESMIQRLLPKLQILWPNMYVDTSFASFWEHEWSKHGTCASSLPATSTEYLYFNTALTLMSRFEAGKLLKNEHITPGSTKYTLDELTLALTRQIGAKPYIECTKDRTTGKDMVYEVEICLDKQFNPVNCYEVSPENNSNGGGSSHHSLNPRSNCPHVDPIEYPPLDSNGDVVITG